MQLSNEEAKSAEITKLQKRLEAVNLELDVSKLATINECKKVSVLQKQLDSSMKEKSTLERELAGMTQLIKENVLLKVGLPITFLAKY